MSDDEIQGDASSLSVEDTDKLRIKLGLAPLEEAKKQDFVHKPAFNIGDKKLEDKQRQKLNQHRENREIEKKLKEHRPLADENVPMPDFDILAKKAEELRRRKARIEEDDENEIENINDPPVYTGNDLEGMVVEHSSSRFDSYMPTILTLKDKNILDDENDDVLQNANFADYERYEENVKNKKKGVHYNPQSDDEDDLMGAKPHNLLSKYDDDKKKRFMIGSSGNYDPSIDRNDEDMKFNSLARKISIPEKEAKVASDFYTPEELKARFGTKRKRKARSTRTMTKVAVVKIESKLDDIKPKIEEGELEEENNVKTKKSKSNIDSSMKKERAATITQTADSEEDEIDLRPNLVFKEVTAINPIVRNAMSATKMVKTRVQLEQLLENDDSDDESVIGAGMLTFSTSCDSTDQILRKLKTQQESNTAKALLTKEEPVVVPLPVTPLATTRAVVDNEDQGESSGWQPEDRIVPAPKADRKRQIRPPPVTQSYGSKIKKEMKLTDGVLGDDVQLNKGVFSAIMLAKNKGYLDQPRQETRITNPRSGELRAQNYYEEKIRYDDTEPKGHRRERYTAQTTPFEDKRDYKPEIKLEYNDAQGRSQEPKEAFRTLSHRFHGKSSGKTKCEKRDNIHRKQVKGGGLLVGDVAMRSVDKQYSKQKSENKFCVVLSGKNAILPASLKKMDKKAVRKPPTSGAATDKTSPK